MEVMSKGFDWGSNLGKEVATMIPVLMLSKSNVKIFSGIKQGKHVLYNISICMEHFFLNNLSNNSNIFSKF